MATTTKKDYTEAVGRRKTAIARVRIHKSTKNSYTINGKDLADYFPTNELRSTATSALANTDTDKFQVEAKVTGGGMHSQAEAVRHGIARSLVKFDENLRKPLKKEGLLTRDARSKERRKFGLKKARKAPQWSKR